MKRDLNDWTRTKAQNVGDAESMNEKNAGGSGT